jgi:hypothetical protein
MMPKIIGTVLFWIRELVPDENNLLLIVVVVVIAEVEAAAVVVAAFATSVLPEMFKFTACTSIGITFHTS